MLEHNFDLHSSLPVVCLQQRNRIHRHKLKRKDDTEHEKQLAKLDQAEQTRAEMERAAVEALRTRQACLCDMQWPHRWVVVVVVVVVVVL